MGVGGAIREGRDEISEGKNKDNWRCTHITSLNSALKFVVAPPSTRVDNVGKGTNAGPAIVYIPSCGGRARPMADGREAPGGARLEDQLPLGQDGLVGGSLLRDPLQGVHLLLLDLKNLEGENS